jgi:hypothetical protein
MRASAGRDRGTNRAPGGRSAPRSPRRAGCRTVAPRGRHLDGQRQQVVAPSGTAPAEGAGAVGEVHVARIADDPAVGLPVPGKADELLVPDARSDAVRVGWWEQRQGGPDAPRWWRTADGRRRPRRCSPASSHRAGHGRPDCASRGDRCTARCCATRCGRPPQPRRRSVYSSRCVGTPRLPRRHAAQPTRSTCPSRSRTG